MRKKSNHIAFCLFSALLCNGFSLIGARAQGVTTVDWGPFSFTVKVGSALTPTVTYSGQTGSGIPVICCPVINTNQATCTFSEASASPTSQFGVGNGGQGSGSVTANGSFTWSAPGSYQLKLEARCYLALNNGQRPQTSVEDPEFQVAVTP
jgi:hypothetical protein